MQDLGKEDKEMGIDDIFQITDVVNEEINLGDDVSSAEERDISSIFQDRKLNGLDILSFAKVILLSLAIIFVITLLLNVFCNSKATEDVWSFVSTSFNSLASIVIGYYFAKKVH